MYKYHKMPSESGSETSSTTGSSNSIPHTPPHTEWGKNLLCLLQDFAGTELFHKYLKREQCENCLCFWQACEGFKKNFYANKSEKNKKLINVINKKYLSSSVLFSVAISYKTRHRLLERITHDKYYWKDCHFFDEAQKEMEDYLSSTHYRNFLSSDCYLQNVHDNIERYSGDKISNCAIFGEDSVDQNLIDGCRNAEERNANHDTLVQDEESKMNDTDVNCNQNEVQKTNSSDGFNGNSSHNCAVATGDRMSNVSEYLRDGHAVNLVDNLSLDTEFPEDDGSFQKFEPLTQKIFREKRGKSLQPVSETHPNLFAQKLSAMLEKVLLDRVRTLCEDESSQLVLKPSDSIIQAMQDPPIQLVPSYKKIPKKQMDSAPLESSFLSLPSKPIQQDVLRQIKMLPAKFAMSYLPEEDDNESILDNHIKHCNDFVRKTPLPAESIDSGLGNSNLTLNSYHSGKSGKTERNSSHSTKSMDKCMTVESGLGDSVLTLNSYQSLSSKRSGKPVKYSAYQDIEKSHIGKYLSVDSNLRNSVPTVNSNYSLHQQLPIETSNDSRRISAKDLHSRRHSSLRAPSPPMSEENTIISYSVCGKVNTWTALKGKNITLGQFKSHISGNNKYRYFFKKVNDDPEIGVAFEVIENDNEVLPLWQGQIFAKIEPKISADEDSIFYYV